MTRLSFERMRDAERVIDPAVPDRPQIPAATKAAMMLSWQGGPVVETESGER